MTLIKLALKNITSRPGRFLLTSLAVLVGVALTSAVFIFTDSLRSTFGDLSADIESGYDIAVRSEFEFGDRSKAAAVEPDIAQLVADIEGVAAVQPRVGELGIIPTKSDGEAAIARGPNIGVNWEDKAPVPRIFIAEGRPPTTSGEFALDIDSAAEDDFVVGTTYRVQTPAGLVDVELVGTFSFGDPEENALVGAKLIAFDTETAVELLNDGKGYDDLTITLVAGADAATVTERLEDVLPDGLEVLGREVIIDEQAAEFNEFIDIFRTILLVFAFVILLVAAFIIYNVFSIIIGQRIQEIGLLRALGATGEQVTKSIAAEALLVGLFATVVGLLLGIPIAAGLQALLSSLDFGPDESSTPVTLTTVIVAAVLGIGITMISAIWPALQARRISPMAALRQDTTVQTESEPNAILGWVLTLSAVLLVVVGFAIDHYLWLLILTIIAAMFLHLGVGRISPPVGRFALVGLATLLVAIALIANLRASMLLALLGAAALISFLGMNVVSPLFAGPVSRFLGAPIAKLGVPGKLARANAARTPARTATAASALMIGLALVTTVAVIAESFKATFAEVLREAVTADWIVLGDQTNPNNPGFSREVAQGLSELPELAAVLPLQWVPDAFRTTVDEDVRTVYAADLDVLADHFDPGFVATDTSLYSPTAVLLHDEIAADLGVGLGDTVEIEFVDSSTQALTVAGIFEDLAIFDSGWVVDSELWDTKPSLIAPSDLFVSAIQTPGVPTEEVRSAIEAVIAPYPQVDASTKQEFQDEQEQRIGQILVIINVLLLVSVLLALLGVAITLALSVFERTREIGLSRAVGATRRQIKRMVRGEGVIVALFGGVLGVGLGLVFGIACVQIIPDDFVDQLALPWGALIAYLILAGVAGLIAAYFPARRAAKLNVLDAIAHG